MEDCDEGRCSEAVECDGDNDGFLTLLEFAFTPRGTDAQPAIFELLDADGDQRLSRDEYVEPRGPARRPAERLVFYNRDVDGDLFLSREEFLVPQESVRPNLRSAYAARDTDDDGKMSGVVWSVNSLIRQGPLQLRLISKRSTESSPGARRMEQLRLISAAHCVTASD